MTNELMECQKCRRSTEKTQEIFSRFGAEYVLCETCREPFWNLCETLDVSLKLAASRTVDSWVSFVAPLVELGDEQ